MTKRPRGESQEEPSSRYRTTPKTEPHLIRSLHTCVMPRQPTANGRKNGCWVPPVVACVGYYKPETGCTLDSILEKLGDTDEEADAPGLLEEHFGIYPATCHDAAGYYLGTGSGADIWEDLGEHSDEDGGMFEPDPAAGSGERINEKWFISLKACVGRSDVAILLCSRLEAAESKAGKASTHYLLVLGYEESRGRRGSTARALLVKDPMVCAEVWGTQPTPRLSGKGREKRKWPC